MTHALSTFLLYASCAIILIDVWGEYFSIMQTNKHFGVTTKHDMMLEKLQKIATTLVEAKFRSQWLRWWNSRSMTRESIYFPLGMSKKITLKTRLFELHFGPMYLLCFILSHLFSSWKEFIILENHFLNCSILWLLIGGCHDEWVSWYERGIG